MVAMPIRPCRLTCIKVVSTTYDHFARFKVGAFANHRNQCPTSGTRCQACMHFMSSSVANDTTRPLTLQVTRSAPSNRRIYPPILAPAPMRTSASPPGPINMVPLPCAFPFEVTSSSRFSKIPNPFLRPLGTDTGVIGVGGLNAPQRSVGCSFRLVLRRGSTVMRRGQLVDWLTKFELRIGKTADTQCSPPPRYSIFNAM